MRNKSLDKYRNMRYVTAMAFENYGSRKTLSGGVESRHISKPVTVLRADETQIHRSTRRFVTAPKGVSSYERSAADAVLKADNSGSSAPPAQKLVSQQRKRVAQPKKSRAEYFKKWRKKSIMLTEKETKSTLTAFEYMLTLLRERYGHMFDNQEADTIWPVIELLAPHRDRESYFPTK